METLVAAKLLVISGCLAIFSSSIMGALMAVPMQNPKLLASKTLNFKQIGAAHIDWIMLGLMSAATGVLVTLFELTLWEPVVWAMVFGAWANPLPYLWRGFGVNAFVFAGGLLQRVTTAMGIISAAAIIYAWSSIFYAIYTGPVEVFS